MPYRALHYNLERRYKTIDRKELDKAYNDLRDAVENCATVEVHLSSAKRILKAKEAKLRAAGLEGSNKEAREASLALELEKFHDNAYESSISAITARADVEIAKIEVRRLEWTIRLLELNTHTT